MTRDFESLSLGSNPSETFCFVSQSFLSRLEISDYLRAAQIRRRTPADHKSPALRFGVHHFPNTPHSIHRPPLFVCSMQFSTYTMYTESRQTTLIAIIVAFTIFSQLSPLIGRPKRREGFVKRNRTNQKTLCGRNRDRRSRLWFPFRIEFP